MESDLIGLIRANSWWMRILRTARDAAVPEAGVGAGALRDRSRERLARHQPAQRWPRVTVQPI
ncbi:hypothetical protein M1L60_42790 [Actinoplanes sp. TRM 88003]|uniref:Uncharacterized protein n=1 Tax=Paractinoplanes aksuensis TaxID=2939490 RepID=A0ABT1E2F6_9ACTN|nr:hypothetical protein [Actinoplanes aksuensis]MCO8277325.1 hypothetical protein [Actinoplanes aksuensis]